MEHRRGILFMIFLMFCSFAFRFVASNFVFPAEGLLYQMGIDRHAVASSLWFQIFFMIMVLLVPLAIWLAIFRENINLHLPHMRLGKKNILLLIGFSIFIQPAIMIVSGLTSFLFPNEISGFVMEAVQQPYWLLMLALAVTPAICEEVVFRGYIQSTYKNKPFWTMALINGLFFAAIHMNPHQFPYAFIMGIFFAYMVFATRSIRAAVISHFVLNASQVSLVWFAERLPRWMERLGLDTYELGAAMAEADAILYDFYKMDSSQNEMVLVALAIGGGIALFTTPFAVWLFREFVKHNKKRVAEYEEKIASEKIEAPAEEIPEITPEPPASKRKHLAIDTALILVILALYVIFVFG